MIIELADTRKAIETLQHHAANINLKRSLLPLIIKGLESVRHHAKVTSRAKDAISKEIGADFVISMESDKIRIWGGKINYDDRLTIYGNNFVELLECCNKALEHGYDTKEIDLTLTNLAQAEELLKKAKQLQQEIRAKLPALHYLNGTRGLGYLYDVTNTYIPDRV